MFSNKCVNRDIINSVKAYKSFSENLEVAKTFNDFSLNIVKEMNIFRQELVTEADHIDDPVFRITERFKKHLSAVAIFENHKDNAFSFRRVPLDETTNKIKMSDMKIACQNTDIATKFTKNNSNIFADFFFLTSAIA